jgi:hypothetical protein
MRASSGELAMIDPNRARRGRPQMVLNAAALLAWLLCAAADVPDLGLEGRRLQQQPAQPRCPAAHLSARAVAVTQTCCAAATPSTPGSGHRRVQGMKGAAAAHAVLDADLTECGIPAACPSAECAAAFAGLFADCRPELAATPDFVALCGPSIAVTAPSALPTP